MVQFMQRTIRSPSLPTTFKDCDIDVETGASDVLCKYIGCSRTSCLTEVAMKYDLLITYGLLLECRKLRLD